MIDDVKCPICKARLPKNVPFRECPACLLLAGLSSDFEDEPDGGDLPASTVAGAGRKWDGATPISIPIVHKPGGARPPGPLPKLPNYELGPVLGSGPSSIVLFARRNSPRRTVALKFPSSSHGTSALLDSARSNFDLDHPNLLKVFDCGTEEDQPFVELELAAGGDLNRRLASKPMTEAEVFRLMTNLASAVQYLHDSGRIHGDLRPSNVLFLPDGTVKLGELGADLGETPLNYQAPEQVSAGAAIDERADVYGLGAILYLLLTGRPPYEGDDPELVRREVLRSKLVPPRKRVASVSVALDAVCCMALDPVARHRYSSAAEFADDLARIAKSEQTVAKPMSSITRMARALRRAIRTNH